MARMRLREICKKKHDHSWEFCHFWKCLGRGFLRDLCWCWDLPAIHVKIYPRTRPTRGSKKQGFPPGIGILKTLRLYVNQWQSAGQRTSSGRSLTRIERFGPLKVAKPNAFFGRFLRVGARALVRFLTRLDENISSSPAIALSTHPTNLTICLSATLLNEITDLVWMYQVSGLPDCCPQAQAQE